MTEHDTIDPTYDDQPKALQEVRKACAVMNRPDLFRDYADTLDQIQESSNRAREKLLYVDIATHRRLIAVLADRTPESLIKSTEG